MFADAYFCDDYFGGYYWPVGTGDPTNGPYFVDRQTVFVPGDVRAKVFLPGDSRRTVFLPGPTRSKVKV